MTHSKTSCESAIGNPKSAIDRSKPIIGIAGGIGSGKSFVASLFGEAGCLVLSADQQVTEAYALPEVREEVCRWWGGEAFNAAGDVDRKFIASKIFADENERHRLESLLHPLVIRLRDARMAAAAPDPSVLAFVWDIPLLFETNQHVECDALVFVDAPLDLRLQRVTATRGWDRDELLRREKLQMPLDKKRSLADDVIVNTADAADTRRQVQQVLSRILTHWRPRGTPGR